MKDHDHESLTFDEFDELRNPRRDLCEFDEIVERRISRRGMLGGALAYGGWTALGGIAAPTGAKAASHASTSRLPFTAVAANTDDTITVPPGYSARVLVRWGDPITPDGPAFDPETRGTAESQKVTFGDNTDGMEIFSRDGRNVLVVNNEYTNRKIIWGNRPEGKFETDDDVWKGMWAHGLSVIEIEPGTDGWQIRMDSPVNRRVPVDTPMEITGPARGHDLMKTSADPDGVVSNGTWNNCGSGRTPWGTYLACEENFNGYFSSSEEVQDNKPIALPPEFVRYGISESDWGYGWASVEDRFDISKEPNEPNRAGWVVEVDPWNPDAMPKKRTALGRFKHENAEVVVNNDGRVVVYMGDDERGEFLYRFISDGVMQAAGDNSNLLESGRLFAAHFNDDGTGEWRELTPEATGLASDAECRIHARIAASAVGATTMDRPEWVSANPNAAEVYCCLTNNKNRGIKTNAGGDETPATGPNPRAENHYGQVVRWWPDDANHTSDGFAWDLFVMAGNPTVHSDAYAGSENVDAGNMFNSPDGLAFDHNGIIWIQTDGNYSNEGDFAGHGNNQMLAGDPATGEIRRFLVGPKECEVTGLTWSDDRRAMFVGIQHPGERGNSHWPEGGDAVPRSAIIVITRDDGGPVG